MLITIKVMIKNQWRPVYNPRQSREIVIGTYVCLNLATEKAGIIF